MARALVRAMARVLTLAVIAWLPGLATSESSLWPSPDDIDVVPPAQFANHMDVEAQAIKSSTHIVSAQSAANAAQLSKLLAPKGPINIGFCVVNGLNTAMMIGNFVQALTSSIRACPFKRLHNLQEKCAADALSLIASMASMASILSGMASSCGSTININAGCSASGSGLAAILMSLSASASNMGVYCHSIRTDQMKKAVIVHNYTASQLYSCTAMVVAALDTFAQAGMAIDLSTKSCNTDYPGIDSTMMCPSNIMSIVLAFVQAANALMVVSGAACRDVVTLDSIHELCAATVINVVSLIASLAQWGMGISKSCGSSEEHGSSATEMEPDADTGGSASNANSQGDAAHDVPAQEANVAVELSVGAQTAELAADTMVLDDHNSHGDDVSFIR